jgi:hypothetical protein
MAATDEELSYSDEDQQSSPIITRTIGRNPIIPSAPSDASSPLPVTPQLVDRPARVEPQQPGPLTPPARAVPRPPVLQPLTRPDPAQRQQNVIQRNFSAEQNYQDRMARFNAGQMFDKQQAALKAERDQLASQRATQGETYDAQQQETRVVNRDAQNTLRNQGVVAEEDPATGLVRPATDDAGKIQFRANKSPEDKQIALDTELHAAGENALGQNIYEAARNLKNTVQLSNQYQNFDKNNPSINETEGGFLGIMSRPTAVAQGLQKQKADLEEQIRGLQGSGADPNAPLNLQELIKNARQAHASAKAEREAWRAVAPKTGGEINQLIEDRQNDVLAAGKDPAKDPVLTAIESRRAELGIQKPSPADEALRDDPVYGPAISKARAQVSDAQAQVAPLETLAGKRISALESILGLDKNLTAPGGDASARLGLLLPQIENITDPAKKGRALAVLSAIEPLLPQLRQNRLQLQALTNAHDSLRDEWQKKFTVDNASGSAEEQQQHGGTGVTGGPTAPPANTAPQTAPINPKDFDTKLSNDDEASFQDWKTKTLPGGKDSYDPHAPDDYDYRGAWKAGVTPDASGHWPDTFKKPNHQTFSDESIYANARPDLAGHWQGETFVPNGGTEPSSIFSDAAKVTGGAVPQSGATQDGTSEKSIPDLITGASPVKSANAFALPEPLANLIKGTSFEKDTKENLDKPIVQFSPHLIETGLALNPVTQIAWAQLKALGVSRGVSSGISDFVSGLTTPANIALLVSTAGAPTIISKLVGLGFTPQIAKGVYEESKSLVNERDWDKKAKAMTGILLNSAMLLGIGKHLVEKAPSTENSTGQTQNTTPEAAHAEIDALQPNEHVAPEQLKPTQDALRGLVKIASGQSMAALTTAERLALFKSPTPDGGRRVDMIRGEDGKQKPVISDATLARVRDIAPTTAQLLPKDEASQRQAILAPQVERTGTITNQPELRDRVQSGSAEDPIEASSEATPQSSENVPADVQKRAGIVRDAIEGLPGKMRTVMLAAGDDPGEIARELGITEQGVSNLKTGALHRLRDKLTEQGISGIDDQEILQIAKPESKISEGDRVRDTSTGKKGGVTHVKGNRATVSLDEGGLFSAKITSLERAGESPTGIKNAIVDKQRQAKGLPERMAPLRKTNPQAWDSAMEKIDRNPIAGRELIAKLKENPEPLKPEDSALLTHETVTRENAFDAAIEDVNNAKTPDGLAEAKQRLDLARNDVQELYDVGQRAGTESGQSLQARKMMVNRDYSLAKMEATKRAIANDGKPLSEAQLAEVKAAHDKIAELQAKINEHETKGAEAEMSAYFNQLLKSTKTEAKQGVSQGKSLTSFLDDQAAKARDRIIARRGRLQVTVDPLNVAGLVDEAIIGASHIAKGVTKFSDWSKAMLKDFGERIAPYLAQLFDRAQKYHDAHAKLFASEGEKGTPKAILSKIGDSIDELTQKHVYDLARAHVNHGIADLDGVMKSVTRDLQQKFPDITERDVRDRFSGYGEIRLPSKAKDLAALRDLRRQAQLVSALEDAQKGESPKKSGMQRDTPSDTVRELQRKVVEAMRDSGLQVIDPERQLANNLQRYKTSLRNRTAELQRKILAGDYTKRTQTQTQLDNEAMKLKAAYETERQKFETQIEKDRLAKRPFWQKSLEQIAGTARMSALSGYHTLLKLAGYDLAKFVETPVAELVGAGISKIPGMRGISEKANLESGSTLKAIGDFYIRAATKGMVEAWRVIRTGKTEAKTLYGKPDYQPPKWYDFFGNVHMAEKAPLITGTQAMYLRRAVENSLRAGIDPSNEFARAAINKAVYDHSQKAILQENNKFAEAVNALHSRLEAVNPKTGQVDIANAIISTLVKTFLTKGIVRTPANYFAQTIARTPIGLVTGVTKAAMAHYRGIGNLHPVEANAIHALIKTGAVGSAFFILGMIDATKKEEDRWFGGYWEPGRKRGTGDVDWGKIRITGMQLPHLLTHNPLTESAQMGSTMMRVAMSKFRKKDEDTQGMTKGAIRAIVGLAGKAPLASPVMRAGEGRSDVAADLMSGLVPQLLQNIAEDTDQKERAPKTTTEKIKSAIPGLRETVPEKTDSKSQGIIPPRSSSNWRSPQNVIRVWKGPATPRSRPSPAMAAGR